MKISRIGAICAGTTVAAGTTALGLGKLAWSRAASEALRELEATSSLSYPRTSFSTDQLATLPAPAARYFTFALENGQPLIRQARFTQKGAFAIRSEQWSRFTSVEHVSVFPPGFVWNARIRTSPFFSIFVRDGYVGKVGFMEGKTAGLFPVLSRRGTPEMASGALMRYLSESVLFPTSLLPSEHISWEGLDAERARVTLTDGATTVSLDVFVNDTGEIVRASGERYRDAPGGAVSTPWICRYQEYRRMHNMMIPLIGEAEWVLPEGPFPYWRARTVDANYTLVTSETLEAAMSLD